MPSKRRDRASEEPAESVAEGGAGAPAIRPAYTLLVRLWRETRAAAAQRPVWRGTVSDLDGRTLGSFSSAAELARIVGEISSLNVLLRVSRVERGGDTDGADEVAP